MKTLCITFLTAVSMSCIAQASPIQSYWVIESNVKTESTLIRFYDHQHHLIHQDTIDGKRLSVTKRKHRKWLDQKLKQVQLQHSIALDKKRGQD
ncbi:MAG: hypothetical protein DI538_20925 [Azospira oryzae]|jgi:hypothetical protein|nr:MAG: hypothetical protein DI538_20925 [Azospira oryzae]